MSLPEQIKPINYLGYERTQETLALLKLLSLSRQQIAAGQVEQAEDVIARLRKKYRDH